MADIDVKSLKIAILGGGRMGNALAVAYTRAGLDVTIGSRSEEQGKERAEEVKKTVPGANVHGTATGTAIEQANVIFITVPPRSSDGNTDLVNQLLDQHKSSIVGKGKVMVDLTGPWYVGVGGPRPCGEFDSAVEYHAKHLGDSSTHWVSAYKVIYYLSLLSDKKQAVEIAGDAHGRAVVSAILKAHGWWANDRGDLSNAPLLEPKGPKRQAPQ